MSRRPFEPQGTTMTITPTGKSAFVLNWVELTPPNRDGGDPISTVTLGTQKHKTKMAPKLIDVGNVSFNAEWQPNLDDTAPINENGKIVITIPGEGQFEYRGYLKNINPDALKTGERAMTSGELVITNTADDGFTEVPPKFTAEEDAADMVYHIAGLTLVNLQALYTALGGTPGAMTADELVDAIMTELAGA